MLSKIAMLLLGLTLMLSTGFDCNGKDKLRQQVIRERQEARQERERSIQAEDEQRRLLLQAEIDRTNMRLKLAAEETRRSWYATYTLVVAGALAISVFILGRLYQTRAALLRVLGRVLHHQRRQTNENTR